MRALVVGAGAVGQVYGQALQRGGVEVAFLVKPEHADAARAGFTMYPLDRARRGRVLRFEGFGVLTSAGEIREAGPWDQVWLAVPSTALAGDWLPAVVAATGEASVVCLQPLPDVLDRVAAFAGERLVQGIIAMIAYQAPLPGETRFPAPGVAFLLPRGGSPFHGPAARVEPIVAALRAGACPASVSEEPLVVRSAFGSALLQAHVAGLDAAGWSWTAVRGRLALVARAWREMAAVAAREHGVRPPWWTPLVRPVTSRLAMAVARRILPLDVPTYFGFHFTKVGAQTRANLDGWIARGRAAGLEVGAIEALRASMRPEPAFDPSATVGPRGG